jgi:predicted RNA binding protein YcfA (HicA-like mRNA interferase family)
VPRITPQHWQKLECVFTRAGFLFVRQASSHRVYEKTDVLRPVIIPAYEEIDPGIISGLLRTANMSRTEYFRLLNEC